MYFFRTFHVLFPYFVVLFSYFFITFSVLFPFFPYSFFKKNQKLKFFLLARAIHREYFLLQCLKKEIATAKELDLRPLGKVIIFRDRQNLPIIYRYWARTSDAVFLSPGLTIQYLVIQNF